MNWYRLNIEEVFKLTGSGPKGLTVAEAEQRLLQSGYNQLEEAKKKKAWAIFLSQFTDLLILILMAAAVVSGIIGDLKDTIVIVIIVVLNAVVGFIQEYRAEKAMQALKKMSATYTKVVREGVTKFINSRELVPGDIVLLEAGNAIPADLRLIESLNLKVEEAALTGESHAVDKITRSIEVNELSIGDRKNMAYKGTFVTYGRGSGIVIASGMQTELGTIAKMLQGKEVLSPLQQRMAAFGKKLSVLVLFLCLVFFIAGWLRGAEVFTMVMTSISLAVAAIPEALPAVITISLALAAKRMIRHNTLIRKLPAVETLGSVTYICTDKTGTLTKNKMHVEEVFVDDKLFKRRHITPDAGAAMKMLLHAFALNNDVINDDGIYKGDTTEIALMEVAAEHHLQTDHFPRLTEIAFDAERKLMTTFHKWNRKFISFTKGAPEILFDRCVDINKSVLQTQVNKMASGGLRVLGFGYRYWEQLPQHPLAGNSESQLHFLGLTGMIDPPREEVSQAIEQCKTAGIVPVMITGDHPLTAKTIATRIGIVTGDEDFVVTGQQLAAMNEEELSSIVERIKVYARVSPEQKLSIVKSLQSKGHFVAMTGDGVNDAPSLKRANIGIAMGITGTDVAKEASHMILTDDKFSTIVRAVREGRRVYDNILKFIKYLMTTNSGELWILLLGPVIGLPVALLPIHILWVNLVSDGLPAISLSFENAEKNIMTRPPRPPQESVFANRRGYHIVWVGLLMAGVTLSAQAFAINNNLHWQTIVFNMMCLSQMAHVLAIRSETQSLFAIGIFSNRPLIFSVLLTFALQAAITYTPFLQPVFNTETLTVYEFLAVGFLSSIVLIAVEVEKAIARKKLTKVEKNNNRSHS